MRLAGQKGWTGWQGGLAGLGWLGGAGLEINPQHNPTNKACNSFSPDFFGWISSTWAELESHAEGFQSGRFQMIMTDQGVVASVLNGLKVVGDKFATG
jgi:hypothetical protein